MHRSPKTKSSMLRNGDSSERQNKLTNSVIVMYFSSSIKNRQEKYFHILPIMTSFLLTRLPNSSIKKYNKMHFWIRTRNLKTSISRIFTRQLTKYTTSKRTIPSVSLRWTIEMQIVTISTKSNLRFHWLNIHPRPLIMRIRRISMTRNKWI